MSSVQLIEIGMSYGTTVALRGCSLTVDSGEYVVVLGASGSGKTSLLRAIAGLSPIESGKILLNGADAAKIPARRRDIALVPQGNGLYPHLSVARSIELGIRDKLGKEQLQLRVNEAAQTVELLDQLDQLPQQLSGGQLRRAAIAKAIARRASIRLLDEPFSAIDAGLRFDIEKSLRRLHQSIEGITIHVTHDGAVAMRLADKIAVIENHRVIQCDRPENVYRRPASVAVARALGASPFSHREVLRREETWVTAEGIALAGPAADDGTRAVVGFYQDDERPVASHATQKDADWIDPARNVAVAEIDLRWFIP